MFLFISKKQYAKIEAQYNELRDFIYKAIDSTSFQSTSETRVEQLLRDQNEKLDSLLVLIHSERQKTADDYSSLENIIDKTVELLTNNQVQVHTQHDAKQQQERERLEERIKQLEQQLTSYLERVQQ